MDTVRNVLSSNAEIVRPLTHDREWINMVPSSEKRGRSIGNKWQKLKKSGAVRRIVDNPRTSVTIQKLKQKLTIKKRPSADSSSLPKHHTKPIRLLDFPAEILFEIFSHVSGPPPDEPFPLYRPSLPSYENESYRYLLDLLLVSKTFYSIAIRLLYLPSRVPDVLVPSEWLSGPCLEPPTRNFHRPYCRVSWTKLTLLHYSAIRGYSTTIRNLLDITSVDINGVDTAYTTALEYAIRISTPEIVDLLVSSGASITKSSNIETVIHNSRPFLDTYITEQRYHSMTPLHLAVLYGNKRKVTTLIDAGANTLAISTCVVYEDPYEPWSMEAPPGYPGSSFLNNVGRRYTSCCKWPLRLTPLTLGAAINNTDAVSLLVESAPQKVRNQAMMMAVAQCSLGSFDILKYWVRHDVTHACGAGLLHIAAYVDSEESGSLVKSLVYMGAKVDAENGMGQTPLTLALYRGNFVVVKALVEAGADTSYHRVKNWLELEKAREVARPRFRRGERRSEVFMSVTVDTFPWVTDHAFHVKRDEIALYMRNFVSRKYPSVKAKEWWHGLDVDN
ncbi:ankyrin repeat-containing domain protein [Pyronema omphalodes]|nr:ankyrin repeat-containing domain protein [Pyronema omphalodes]